SSASKEQISVRSLAETPVSNLHQKLQGETVERNRLPDNGGLYNACASDKAAMACSPESCPGLLPWSPPWSLYASPNHCRNDWATCSASVGVSRPTRFKMRVSCTVYSPRFTAVGTWSPAAAQSARTNSSARREVVRLVSGTMKTSCDTAEH